MPQPSWVTPAGNFGSYTEGTPIAQTFVASPSTGGYTLEYTLLNSSLPTATVAFTLNQSTGLFSGTPGEVGSTETYYITIRVNQYNGIIFEGFRDRTFSFIVSGATEPTFLTAAGALYPGPGYLSDSTWSPYQILVNNPDPDSIAVVRLIDGDLPPGLEINDSGLIRGFSDPVNTNYPFTLEVSSASGVATRNFSIQITQQTALTRPPAIINTTPPSYTIAPGDPNSPYYLAPSGDIGTIAQNDYFIFKVLGTSFASGPISYSRTGTLPPGCTDNLAYTASNTEFTITFGGAGYNPGDQLRILGSNLGGVTPANDMDFTVVTVSGGTLIEISAPTGLNTDGVSVYNNLAVQTVTGGGAGAIVNIKKIPAGWISGNVTVNPLLEVAAYTFTYTAINTYNSLTSSPQAFNVTVVSQQNNVPFSTELTWTTPGDLGIINNGSTSNLYVEAVSASGLDLTYTLTSGSLPPSLTFASNGQIIGKVAFETETTLTPEGDSNIYTFTATATSSVYPTVTTTKSFTITVYQNFDEPYENLYIKALLSLGDRAILDDLLTNTNIFPPDWIYRPTDTNFGLSTAIVYQHMYGVPASSVADYIFAVNENHYRRYITLGPLETAIAKNSEGTIIYEVVYCKVIDDLVNASGVSVIKQFNWPYPINGLPKTVYPNSLPNMRQQIENTLGQDTQSAILPAWMTSQQEDGGNIGYTAVWVVCYTKPGYSEIIKKNIESPLTAQISVTATDSINSVITCASTEGFYLGMRVNFSGTVFGGLGAGVDYFVNNIVSANEFTVSSSNTGSPTYPLITATGLMYVEHVDWGYKFNELTFKIDRFEVNKQLSWEWDPNTSTWSTLPSGVDTTDSQDQYIYFKKDILS